MSGPLAGLRVVELSGLGPAPLAGQLLADLGADVVAIDRKSRRADPAEVNRRGKRSAALNLKHPSGVDATKAIIARADVLIEGFRPGVMEKLGLGPETCQAANPRLIYARMTGWGQDGPMAMTAGHDINYLGITGALHAIGPRDGPPLPPLNLAADYAGGTMFLLFGILSALFERGTSGRGQVVDAAMIEGVPAMMGLLHQFMAGGLWQEARASNMLDGGAPYYRCYTTADGRAISVGAIEPQFFAEFLARAGLPEDDRARQNDHARWPEMHARYAAHFATRTMAEWVAVFAGSDACVGPVLTTAEAADHPQNTARGVFLDRDGTRQAMPAPKFDRTPAPRPRPVGAPGADTAEILAEAGLDEAKIAALRVAGALT